MVRCHSAPTESPAELPRASLRLTDSLTPAASVTACQLTSDVARRRRGVEAARCMLARERGDGPRPEQLTQDRVTEACARRYRYSTAAASHGAPSPRGAATFRDSGDCAVATSSSIRGPVAGLSHPVRLWALAS